MKELAASEGLLATFMAKPLTDSEGSSHHVHASLWRGDENAFDDGGQISAEARAFAAGLIVHAEGLTALAAPTINSYKRLGNGEMCPSIATLGGDSRQAYVRVPPERGRRDARRAARRRRLRQPVSADRGHARSGARRNRARARPGHDSRRCLCRARSTPRSTALEGDAVLAEMLGPQLLEAMVAVKRREIERFNLAVTDWEWREYATHA